MSRLGEVASKGVSNLKAVLVNVDAGRAAIAAGVVLIVAILAGLGVAGDYLTRMVRNHPVEVSLIFFPILAGLVLPFLIPKEKRTVPIWRTSGFFGLVLVFIGAGLAVVFSATSFGDREEPTLTAQPVWSATVPGSATVTFTATGTSLREKESMLLRVIGITPTHAADLSHYCNSSSEPGSDPTLGGKGKVLAWETSGPSVAGNASVSVVLPVSSSEFKYVCAYTALFNRSQGVDHRSVWAVIDLTSGSTGVNATPIPTPSAIPTPTPSK